MVISAPIKDKCHSPIAATPVACGGFRKASNRIYISVLQHRATLPEHHDDEYTDIGGNLPTKM
jgi:hypothetical protein